MFSGFFTVKTISIFKPVNIQKIKNFDISCSKVASIPEIRDRIKLFTENLTKFLMLAIEADRAEWRKRAKIRNFVKFLVSQLIRPHCSASDATLKSRDFVLTLPI